MSGAPDRRRVPPPGGAAPPEEADGIRLRPLAEQVTELYAAEYPDEDERYEPAVWRAWCIHDVQYLLQWAILDVAGVTKLDEQAQWLARVLAARGFPVDRLARSLELCADVIGRDDVAARLREVAPTLTAG